MRRLLFLLALAPLLAAAYAAAQSRPPCPDCDFKLEARRKAIAEEFAADIHAQKGMGCGICHAGASQGRRRSTVGGIASIRRERIPELCGSCHADAGRIKQFNPSLRTDQLAQYRTSVHGIKFAHGDKRVAVCTDCHTVHSIRPVSDPRSTIHPLNIAETCKRCHTDADYMKPYRVATDQFAGYTDSVHHEAMVLRGDLSAPACTTCHGSHGAVPPGVKSVANVCAKCHVLQAQFFEESPHKKIFALMDLPGCVTCHSSHRIKHPDDTFVGTGPKAVCGNCHTPDERAGQVANGMHDRFHHLEAEIADAKAVLDRAQRSGMDVAESQLELTQANDALTKARATLHTAQLTRVAAEVEAGAKIADKGRIAGETALRERNDRRKAVLFPVIAIVALVFSLGAYVRELERGLGD